MSLPIAPTPTVRGKDVKRLWDQAIAAQEGKIKVKISKETFKMCRELYAKYITGR